MSCAKFENEVALYAGGDLPDGRMARVESHLAVCADCRALADDLRASHTLLGGLRDDPLQDALADVMVARVHHRVLAEVGSTGDGRRRVLVPLLAFAAALLLAAVLLWPRHAAKQAPLAHATPAAPAPQPASIVPVQHRAVHHRHRRTAPAAQPGPPLLVQFVTDDPNIVVYWLVDQKPQGD